MDRYSILSPPLTLHRERIVFFCYNTTYAPHQRVYIYIYIYYLTISLRCHRLLIIQKCREAMGESEGEDWEEKDREETEKTSFRENHRCTTALFSKRFPVLRLAMSPWLGWRRPFAKRAYSFVDSSRIVQFLNGITQLASVACASIAQFSPV